jgi:colicin import membrane protein
MSTAHPTPKLPDWDLAKEAAEDADGKDKRLCNWPGCERPNAPPPPDGGRPPEYCRQADAEGEQAHDSVTANAARRSARNAAQAAAAPVSSAYHTLNSTADRLDEQSTKISDSCSGISEAAATLRDPETSLHEIRMLHADLQYEGDARQAAEADATRCRELLDEAHQEIADKHKTIAALSRAERAAKKSADRAMQVARAAHHNRTKAQKQRREAEAEADRLTDAIDVMARERDEARAEARWRRAAMHAARQALAPEAPDEDD